MEEQAKYSAEKLAGDVPADNLPSPDKPGLSLEEAYQAIKQHHGRTCAALPQYGRSNTYVGSLLDYIEHLKATPAPAAAGGAGLLGAELLHDMRSKSLAYAAGVMDEQSGAIFYEHHMPALLAAYDALAQQLQQAAAAPALGYAEWQQQLAAAEGRADRAERRLREERETLASHVLDILRDMRLPRLPLPDTYGPDGEELVAEMNLICGQNIERQAINDYCRQKAYEYSREGIGPDPTEVGQWDTLPPPAPEAAPAAAVPVGAGEWPKHLFDTKEDYEAALNKAARAIEAGEVPAREPQPWCARCPATEAQVNAPGFECAQCKAAGIW